MKNEKNYMIIESSPVDIKKYVELKTKFDGNRQIYKEGVCKKIQSQDDLQKLMEKHSAKTLSKKVKHAFQEFYNISLEEVEIITEYTAYETNASYTGGDKKVIHIDPLLFDGLHDFFVICYIWEDFMYHDEKKISRTQEDYQNATFMNDIYFKYFTTIFYAIIEDQTLCDIYKFMYVIERYRHIGEGNEAIFNVIIACQFCATYFCVAHECAHAYFDLKGISFTHDDKYSADEYEEFEADKLAFNLVIKMIKDEEESNINPDDRELYPYSYMAPMMLIDFYKAYMTIKYAIRKSDEAKQLKANAIARHQRLMNYYYEYFDKYCFPYDTDKGNEAYNGVLNSIDKYNEMLEEYKANGKFDEIITFLKNC